MISPSLKVGKTLNYSLFYGKGKQTLLVPDTNVTTSKIEFFSQLIVDVPGEGGDIYEALDGHFALDKVLFNGNSAFKHVTLDLTPPVLQIQIQRVQFDRIKGEAYKSNANLKYYASIFLDRYLESVDTDLIRRREELWHWKEEMEKLKLALSVLKRNVAVSSLPSIVINTFKGATTGLEALKFTKAWLINVQQSFEPPGLVSVLHEIASYEIRIRQTIEGFFIFTCEKFTDAILDYRQEIHHIKAKIAELFSNFRQHEYRLHCVFFHRGSASYGHYFVYICDFKNDKWYKYNDGKHVGLKHY